LNPTGLNLIGSNFNGQIDDVRIWSAVRTPDEIWSDMRTAASGTEAGLEAYYKLDDGQGTAAHDATENHRDATVETMGTSLPSWVRRSDQPIDLVGSIFPDGHEALRFDGSGGYVRLPSFTLGGALTLEAWVKSDDVQANYARVFDFYDGSGL